MGIFVFGSYPMINIVQKAQAQKAILFRNALAANLCKCEKPTGVSGQALCQTQVSQTVQ